MQRNLVTVLLWISAFLRRQGLKQLTLSCHGLFVRCYINAYLFHIWLLCFIVEAPRFYVFWNKVQLVEDMESQSALFFPKMLVDYRSILCERM